MINDDHIAHEDGGGHHHDQVVQDGGQGHGWQDIRAEGREGAGLGEESQDRCVLFLVVVFKEGFAYLLCEDVQRKTIQDVQVGFGGTHPPQCLSSWKGEGSSIWSVSQIAAFNIDNV